MELTEKEASGISNTVLGAGVVTTLAIWVSLDDPINIPKLLMLSLFSAWIFGQLILPAFKKPRNRISSGQIMVGLFMGGTLVAALATDEKYLAFYGALGRRNGAISYLALATVGFAAMNSFDVKSAAKLKSVLVGLGAFMAFYGIFQNFHQDPIRWNLLYSPIVGTLGNPDFVSAFLGACAIATLSAVIVGKNAGSRVFFAGLTILELLVIEASGSLQGLLAFASGSSIIVIATLWKWQKKSGLLALGIASASALPVLFGLMNKGPFAEHLFTGSVKSRIDYWHAAISMFSDHPFLGVGLDRIGDHYWQYAPQVQAVASQGTDNVHNVFLQLAATGGLVLLIPYLLIIGIIALTAIRAARSASSKTFYDIVSLFGIWFALLLASAVSIDTLGVSVWFWICGGALYSISLRVLRDSVTTPKQKGKEPKLVKKTPKKAANQYSLLASVLLVISIFVLVFPVWKSSLSINDLQRNRAGLDKARFIAKAVEISKYWPRNSQTLVYLSDLALRASDPKTSQNLAKEALEKNPISFNANLLIALAYESEKDYLSAIPYRENMVRLNSWQINNLSKLTEDYVTVGNLKRARVIADRLKEINPLSAEALTADKLAKG